MTTTSAPKKADKTDATVSALIKMFERAEKEGPTLDAKARVIEEKLGEIGPALDNPGALTTEHIALIKEALPALKELIDYSSKYANEGEAIWKARNPDEVKKHNDLVEGINLKLQMYMESLPEDQRGQVNPEELMQKLLSKPEMDFLMVYMGYQGLKQAVAEQAELYQYLVDLVDNSSSSKTIPVQLRRGADDAGS